jgi:hypothetical protein
VPATAFLFSVVGVGVSLAGFSGLVIAFRRGAPLKPVDAYRMRLLPEMALAVAFLGLATIPIADAIGNVNVALQTACGFGLLFTFAHILRLLMRVRSEGISQPASFMVPTVTIDTVLLLVAATGVALGTAAIYEWVLLLMLARAALAFVFVVAEETAT